MSDGYRDDTSDVSSGVPIDSDRLDVIYDRLATDDRFAQLQPHPAFAPDRLVCVYNHRLYPERIHRARLEIVWFENGDFSLHYHERHRDGAFDHRWDRHPSSHNARDHIHPGPEAATPGEDTHHPSDWRDVLSMVLTEIEHRQRALWN